MPEQTLFTDKQFLSLLSPFLPKDLIRYSIWAVGRISTNSVKKLYRQCQLADELIRHYQSVYHFTQNDKQIIFAGCLLADVGKYYSDIHYARIGYGLVYEYIARSAPDTFDEITVELIAQCVYDTRPRRRQPASSIHSQLVYLANQGVPSAKALATPIIKALLRSGLTEDEAIIDHTRNELTYQFGEAGVYWRNYPDTGKQYFFDEWASAMANFNDTHFLSERLEAIRKRNLERNKDMASDVIL